jgi:hypothetical protein
MPTLPLEQFLVQRFAATADRNQVLQEACLEYGLHWEMAEEALERAIHDH